MRIFKSSTAKFISTTAALPLVTSPPVRVTELVELISLARVRAVGFTVLTSTGSEKVRVMVPAFRSISN